MILATWCSTKGSHLIFTISLPCACSSRCSIQFPSVISLHFVGFITHAIRVVVYSWLYMHIDTIHPYFLWSFSHRYRLCKQRSYLKFANLPPLDLTEHNRPTSPRYKTPPLSPSQSSLPPLCKWKLVYTKAHILADYWRLGIYNVAPLLRGHRQRVTTISCDGKPC